MDLHLRRPAQGRRAAGRTPALGAVGDWWSSPGLPLVGSSAAARVRAPRHGWFLVMVSSPRSPQWRASLRACRRALASAGDAAAAAQQPVHRHLCIEALQVAQKALSTAASATAARDAVCTQAHTGSSASCTAGIDRRRGSRRTAAAMAKAPRSRSKQKKAKKRRSSKSSRRLRRRQRRSDPAGRSSRPTSRATGTRPTSPRRRSTLLALESRADAEASAAGGRGRRPTPAAGRS